MGYDSRVVNLSFIMYVTFANVVEEVKRVDI